MGGDNNKSPTLPRPSPSTPIHTWAMGVMEAACSSAASSMITACS